MLERDKPETTGEAVLGGILYIVVPIVGYFMITGLQSLGLGFNAAAIVTSAIVVAFFLFGHLGWRFLMRLIGRD